MKVLSTYLNHTTGFTDDFDIAISLQYFMSMLAIIGDNVDLIANSSFCLYISQIISSILLALCQYLH